MVNNEIVVKMEAKANTGQRFFKSPIRVQYLDTEN